MRLGLVVSVSAMSLLVAAGTAEAQPEPEKPDDRALEQEYESWFGGGRYEAHYGRAALEVVGLVGLGLVYYWQDPLANKEDWDNPTFVDRLKNRAIRFDTNLNTTNAFLHPLAGAFVYTAGRVNGLSIPASFGYGVIQSFLWEYALEWREKASINDLVFTTIGGATLGEWFYSLGEYLNSAPGGGRFGNQTAAWTLGFPRRIHRAIDGSESGTPPEPLPGDSLGFSSAFAHRFGLSYEAALLSNDAGDKGAMHSARIGAEIISMPRFLQPISFARSFWNGNFTELNMRLGWANTGNVETDLQTRATIFGHYSQEFDDDGDGHGLMVGVGPALRFQASSWLGREDQLSAVHVGGPHVELWIREGLLAARFGGETYLDFASIKSLAYPKFLDRFNDVELKSVLQRQGSAYSLGSWSRFRADVAYGIGSIGGSVGYGSWGTIEGADRFQERLTQDAHGSESDLEIEGHAALQVSILALGANYRERRRGSTLSDVVTHRLDRAFGVSIGLVF